MCKKKVSAVEWREPLTSITVSFASVSKVGKRMCVSKLLSCKGLEQCFCDCELLGCWYCSESPAGTVLQVCHPVKDNGGYRLSMWVTFCKEKLKSLKGVNCSKSTSEFLCGYLRAMWRTSGMNLLLQLWITGHDYRVVEDASVWPELMQSYFLLVLEDKMLIDFVFFLNYFQVWGALRGEHLFFLICVK